MKHFLFSGEGRLDRLGYLFALLAAGLLFVIPLALLLPGTLPGGIRLPDSEVYREVVTVVGALCWLVVLWIYCAVTARRLHDMNRSGWLTLLALLPLVGLGAMTLLLLLAPGSKTSNRYGARWL